MRNDVHAEHAAEHRDADLNPDACQKPDQHRARQEIREEAQFEDARQQKEARGQQSQHADQRHIFLAGERRHARERVGEDRRGRGISRNDQMARGAEDREGYERQKDRVEAGDDRVPAMRV